MDPDLAGFIGLAALMVTLVAWLRIDMGGRMDRLEATQSELRERMDGLDAELHAARADLSRINERMARTEGTVAGALGRPFPELTTRPADATAAAAAAAAE